MKVGRLLKYDKPMSSTRRAEECRKRKLKQQYIDGWNAAVKAAAYRAWSACKNDIYVKQAGLEKIVPMKIRELRRMGDNG